ncbi:MAG: tyrosine-type recombinase/integrase [Candidatus Binatia bacterium]
MAKAAAAKHLKVVTSPSTELAGLVDDWLAEARARGLSPRSTDMGRAVLTNKNNGLLTWCAERGITTAEQLDQSVLEDVSRYLLEEHKTPKGELLSRESVRTYLRTVRGFVKWAQKRGDLGAMTTPMPKAPQRTVDVLTVREINDMERAAKSERDKLIIRLLGDVGLRLGELLAITPEDLIPDRDPRRNARYLHIKGKGSRERVVPIDPRLFGRLQQYAKRPQALQAATNRIFLTERRSGGGYVALSQRAVQQAVRYIAEDAGIDTSKRRIHPHLFRHSAITRMVNNGMPVEHIRQHVGHADLSLITNVYAHVTPNDRYDSYLAMLRREDADTR